MSTVASYSIKDQTSCFILTNLDYKKIRSKILRNRLQNTSKYVVSNVFIEPIKRLKYDQTGLSNAV